LACESAAAVAAIHGRERGGTGGVYVVSRAANARGEALLARIHGAALVHVVEGDAGDGVSEFNRCAAVRIDLGPRPDAPSGDHGDLGPAVRTRAAHRQYDAEGSRFSAWRLAVECSRPAAERPAARVRRCVDTVHGESR